MGGTGWPARGIEEEDGDGVDDGDVNRAVVAFVGRMWEIRRRSLTADGKGIDFEAYSEFWSAEDNHAWIVAWTGNDGLAGGQFRFFGQDGTGGMAGIWLADPTPTCSPTRSCSSDPRASSPSSRPSARGATATPDYRSGATGGPRTIFSTSARSVAAPLASPAVRRTSARAFRSASR